MPVVIRTFVTPEPDTLAAVADLRGQLADLAAPNFVFVFYSSGYDDSLLHSFLREWAPATPVAGGSSGRGVMSHDGLAADRSIGLMGIWDDDGAFGAAATPLGEDPSIAAEQALHRALGAADALGELPELVWIYQAPGHEEEVLAGLRRVVGDRCPIVGGSAAAHVATPHGVAGIGGEGWRQFGPDGPMADGLVVAALFPSGGLAVSYQSGFEPLGFSGVITELGAERPAADAVPRGARVGRLIETIDGELAAHVYDRWTSGALPARALAEGGEVSVPSAWYPLGVVAGTIDGLTYFRLVHVDAITQEGGLRTFAAVGEGVRVYAMRGSRTSLINRAGRVAGSAIAMLAGDGGQPAGALMAYCIGCRLAVGDEIGDVAASARDGFHGAPFLGCFTAGEQGPVLVENVHANLMISAVVFGR